MINNLISFDFISFEKFSLISDVSMNLLTLDIKLGEGMSI